MRKKINVNLLYCWGNQAINDLDRDYIKMITIKQIISDENFLSSFVKIYNNFLNCSDFKKEVMADLIVIYLALTDSVINLDDNICKDIVDNASIETIGFYGDMISHDNLRMLCINKFWNYVFDFYDFSSHDKDDSKYLKKLVVYKYRKDDK